MDLSEFNYLVIDDDPLSHEVLSGTLRFLGASRINCAEGMDSALRLSRQQRPDFVLLDIYMPEADGWELVGQLRKHLPQAAILMVTGSNRHEDFNQSIDQRVDGFCIKPVMPEVMRKALVTARFRRQAAFRG